MHSPYSGLWRAHKTFHKASALGEWSYKYLVDMLSVPIGPGLQFTGPFSIELAVDWFCWLVITFNSGRHLTSKKRKSTPHRNCGCFKQMVNHHQLFQKWEGSNASNYGPAHINISSKPYCQRIDWYCIANWARWSAWFDTARYSQALMREVPQERFHGSRKQPVYIVP